MATINKISVDGTLYDIEDALLRETVSGLEDDVSDLEEDTEVATSAELIAALFS